MNRNLDLNNHHNQSVMINSPSSVALPDHPSKHAAVESQYSIRGWEENVLWFNGISLNQ